MKKVVLAALLGAIATVLVTGSYAIAQRGDGGGGGFHAKLNGYQEVVGGPGASTGSVSTIARGRFDAHVRGGTIVYRLSYENLEGGAATQAHIHFAQRHVGGGVIAFLCGGGDKPPCPSPGGTVEGVIDPTDIIGPTDQGIEPGSFAEAVRAMRAGATYANVHSTRWPEGEIRGQIRDGGRGRD